MLILAIFTDMKNDRKKFLLNRSNYKILIISVFIILFGYVLMSGMENLKILMNLTQKFSTFKELDWLQPLLFWFLYL